MALVLYIQFWKPLTAEAHLGSKDLLNYYVLRIIGYLLKSFFLCVHGVLFQSIFNTKKSQMSPTKNRYFFPNINSGKFISFSLSIRDNSVKLFSFLKQKASIGDSQEKKNAQRIMAECAVAIYNVICPYTAVITIKRKCNFFYFKELLFMSCL